MSIQKMVDYAVAVAKDDSHGYSQVRRWPDEGTDFDCSSLMYESADHAGYKVKRGWPRYTGSMLADFTAAGFTALRFDGNLSDLDPGDIMLNVEQHTEMYIGNGKFVGAHSSETGGIDGKPGDQTGKEISVVNAYTLSYGWDYVLVPPKDAATITPVKSTAKLMFGIDVSSNQPRNVCATAQHDFAIVKMSGNPHGYAWNYVNPYAKQQMDDAYKKHGRVGLYHFAYGKQAEVEAEFFVEQVKKLGYLGKAILALDYEADAVSKGQTWVKKFCDKVRQLAGYSPIIYASGSVIVDQNLFSIGYPIWCASYYKGYVPVNGRSTNGLKIYSGCEKSIMWQFTSVGRVNGYDGAMDCNVFYGNDADWHALHGAKPAAKPAKLSVDGVFGALTKKELQRQLGVKVTGKFDKATKKALQKRIGVAVDGVWGPKSKAAYRKKLGLAENAAKSTTVKALQKALNAGKIAKW